MQLHLVADEGAPNRPPPFSYIHTLRGYCWSVALAMHMAGARKPAWPVAPLCLSGSCAPSTASASSALNVLGAPNSSWPPVAVGTASACRCCKPPVPSRAATCQHRRHCSHSLGPSVQWLAVLGGGGRRGHAPPVAASTQTQHPGSRPWKWARGPRL